MKFKNKEDLTNWAYDKFDQYNIPKPESYTAEELIYLNPTVPVEFIRNHVARRDRFK